MKVDLLDAYLARLAQEFHQRGILDRRTLEEVRSHLIDAAERGVERGLAEDTAQREALARFGAAEFVAERFASARYRWRHRSASFFAWMLLRRRSGRSPTGHDEGFHDRPGTCRSNRELVAMATNPDAGLVRVLERMAPPPLGPLGTLQSLTAVDDSRWTKGRTTRHRAVFGARPQIVCHVELDRAGQRASVHWSRLMEEEPS